MHIGRVGGMVAALVDVERALALNLAGKDAQTLLRQLSTGSTGQAG